MEVLIPVTGGGQTHYLFYRWQIARRRTKRLCVYHRLPRRPHPRFYRRTLPRPLHGVCLPNSATMLRPKLSGLIPALLPRHNRNTWNQCSRYRLLRRSYRLVSLNPLDSRGLKQLKMIGFWVIKEGSIFKPPGFEGFTHKNNNSGHSLNAQYHGKDNYT